MELGVNYPWCRSGWDFGPSVLRDSQGSSAVPVPAWSDPAQDATSSGSLTRLDQDLKRFKGLGITSVRWFILADGWNCGTPIWDGSLWQYDPPDVKSLGMTDQFEYALQVFQRNQCTLLPSLISHLFISVPRIVLGGKEKKFPASFKSVPDFASSQYKLLGLSAQAQSADPDWNKFIKGGKFGFLPLPSKRQKFYDNVLSPFLQVVKNYRTVVPVFELISEPDGFEASGIDSKQIYSFLSEGLLVLQQNGVVGTIGFAKRQGLDDFLALASSDKKIKQLVNSSWFVPQFHYFADDTQGNLPSASNITIGEFGSSFMLNWPPGAVSMPDPLQGFQDILSAVQASGANSAYAWAFDSYAPQDPRIGWCAELEDAIKQWLMVSQ